MTGGRLVTEQAGLMVQCRVSVWTRWLGGAVSRACGRAGLMMQFCVCVWMRWPSGAVLHTCLWTR